MRIFTGKHLQKQAMMQRKSCTRSLRNISTFFIYTVFQNMMLSLSLISVNFEPSDWTTCSFCYVRWLLLGVITRVVTNSWLFSTWQRRDNNSVRTGFLSEYISTAHNMSSLPKSRRTKHVSYLLQRQMILLMLHLVHMHARYQNSCCWHETYLTYVLVLYYLCPMWQKISH